MTTLVTAAKETTCIDILGHFAYDHIAQPHWLILLVIHSENRGNTHTRRMPANLIVAPCILSVFPYDRDRDIKSPCVSPLLKGVVILGQQSKNARN